MKTNTISGISIGGEGEIILPLSIYLKEHMQYLLYVMVDYILRKRIAHKGVCL